MANAVRNRRLGLPRPRNDRPTHRSDVRFLDPSGAYALSDIIKDMNKAGTAVFLTELDTEPRELLERLGVAPSIMDESHIFASAEDAIVTATQPEAQGSQGIYAEGTAA